MWTISSLISCLTHMQWEHPQCMAMECLILTQHLLLTRLFRWGWAMVRDVHVWVARQPWQWTARWEGSRRRMSCFKERSRSSGSRKNGGRNRGKSLPWKSWKKLLSKSDSRNERKKKRKLRSSRGRTSQSCLSCKITRRIWILWLKISEKGMRMICCLRIMNYRIVLWD